jgi:Taurine catabolism dioxygenase TauD, TfdA family
MSIEVIPTGAAIGAEIRGVNLAQPLDRATFAAVEDAYNTYGVIFFRDQSLTPSQQVAFTRRFGEIEFNIFGERWSVPGNPEIVVISNITEENRPVGFAVPERIGTATCATRRGRHAARCFTPSRSPSYMASPWATQSLPVRRRRGRHCLNRSNAGLKGGVLCSISLVASAPFLPLRRRLIAIHR